MEVVKRNLDTGTRGLKENSQYSFPNDRQVCIVVETNEHVLRKGSNLGMVTVEKPSGKWIPKRLIRVILITDPAEYQIRANERAVSQKREYREC